MRIESLLGMWILGFILVWSGVVRGWLRVFIGNRVLKQFPVLLGGDKVTDWGSPLGSSIVWIVHCRAHGVHGIASVRICIRLLGRDGRRFGLGLGCLLPVSHGVVLLSALVKV